MCEIKIKKVGPVKEVSFTLNKFTVILGPQSSGKSTIAKILCQCQWLERRCFEDFDKVVAQYQKDNYFISALVKYHRMNGYFNEESEIVYKGDFVSITLKEGKVTIKLIEGGYEKYIYPKLNYIPASRNVACLIPNLKKYNEDNDNLLYFMYEWTDAKSCQQDIDLGEILDMPMKYHNDSENERDLILEENGSIELANASSGVLSLLPLMAIAHYGLVDVYNRFKPLSAEQQKQFYEATELAKSITRKYEMLNKKELKKIPPREALEILQQVMKNQMLTRIIMDPQVEADLIKSASMKYFYKRTRLYIEEPEQNLFPDTQAKILYWLIALLQKSDREDSLLLTTHSPFILFALNNCMLYSLVKKDINSNNAPKSILAGINPKEISIYEIHAGELKSIQDSEGLLNDNYINKAYRKIAQDYTAMLSHYDN